MPVNNSPAQQVDQPLIDLDMFAPWIAQYVNLIMEHAGLNHLDQAFRVDYMEQLSVRVQQKIGMIVMESLDDAGFEAMLQFKETHDDSDTEAWKGWFAEHVPDMEKRIQDGLSEFGQTFIESVKAERERLRQQTHDDLSK